MSRLIDADELLKNIISRFGCKPYIEVGNKCEYIHKIIAEQPTAFDTEKVVAELEEKQYAYIHDNGDYEVGKYCAFEESIDIVKRGGVE